MGRCGQKVIEATNMKKRGWGKRGGFTLIELLIVVVIIGILAAIAIPKFSGTKGKARLAAIKSDLKNLATAQEAYLFDNAIYADAAGKLTFTASPGVVITIVEATPGGWSAKSTHPLSFPLECALYVGTAAPIAPATAEGVMFCQ
jgi:prepilin-type N-terminal cleavage/methylation domain-containing protein